jgi:hypothetical protein
MIRCELLGLAGIRYQDLSFHGGQTDGGQTPATMPAYPVRAITRIITVGTGIFAFPQINRELKEVSYGCT